MQPDLLARLVGVERTMEPSLLARLTGVARTVTALAPVRPVTPTLPHLEFGQVVRAQVAARFADGSFRVEIDDTALKLTLPSGTKPGDVLALRFVGREPQLQFELHVPSTEANPRVSSAGRLIGQLLSEPAGLPPRQAQPVVATPTTEPAQLREPLERAVERSGLFYEAHQARWIRGDYPLERLRQEPQAALFKDRQVAEHAHAPDKTQGAAHTPARTSGPAPTDESSELQQHNRPGLVAGERPEGGDRTNRLVPREALPIVRQQLDTLETRHFGWQGEIWPGQLMHWQIAEQDRDAEHPESERDWLTQLRLSLPALGEIGAELGFSPQGVRVSLTAKDSTVAAAMHAAAPELVHALEAAGLGAIVLKVRHGEPSR
jgi:hypothetical protein